MKTRRTGNPRSETISKGKVAGAARSSALVRAEHGGAAVHLTKSERGVLDEALRLGADFADEVENQIASYGRWLLESIFKNDAGEALDAKTKNPVWIELVRRAGGPTLSISRRMLYVSLQIAAYDRRITDQSWRGLDSGRKELLLPLSDDKKLRQGAQHVSRFNLTQTKTREYVSECLAEGGGKRQIRVTAPKLIARMRKMREGLESDSVLRKVRELHEQLEPAERARVVEEIDQLKTLLASLSNAIRGR